MKSLIIDSGPLIGFFQEQDAYHAAAKAGFTQLFASNTALITPISVVFEVYKWLFQNASLPLARKGLDRMLNTLDIYVSDYQQFEALVALVKSLPDWSGRLEDASVLMLAQKYRSPIWTINYRDFSRFTFLSFWNP